MVNMKAVLVDFFATSHANAAITDVYDLPDAVPVGAHEEIAQTTRAAKGMAIKRRLAAHAAEKPSLGVFAPGKTLFVGDTLTVAHGRALCLTILDHCCQIRVIRARNFLLEAALSVFAHIAPYSCSMFWPPQFL